MMDMEHEDGLERLTRALEHAGAAFCGALFAGAVMLMLLGAIGRPLTDSVHLKLPVMTGLLFANPAVFSLVFAATGIGSVIVARVMFEHRIASAAVSAAIGLVGVMGLAVVAGSSAYVIMTVVRVVA
jgi:hypothetical protein